MPFAARSRHQVTDGRAVPRLARWSGPVGLAVVLAGAVVVSPASVSQQTHQPRLVATTTARVAALNTFDNTRDERTLKVRDSYDSGDRFDDVSSGGARTDLVFDSAYKVRSQGKSLRISTGKRAEKAFVGWGKRFLATRTALHASVYLRMPVAPKKSVAVLEFRGNDQRAGLVQVTPKGKLRVTDAAGASSTSKKLPLRSGWLRIEADIDAGSDSLSARAYRASSTTKPIGTSISSGDAGQFLDAVRYGSVTKRKHVKAFWIDSPQVRSDRQPGVYRAFRKVVGVHENFESGGIGAFNHSVGSDVAQTNPVAGSESARFDARSSASWAEMTQSAFGADKRYASVSFRYRFDGARSPSGNVPVLTLRNSSDIDFNGGGHFNLWGDRQTGKFRGDLQSGDSFRTSVPFVTGRTYLIKVKVAYLANGKSKARVWINGAGVGSIKSTTPGKDWFRSVLLGCNMANSDYVASYDDVSVRTGVKPLG